MGVVAVPLIIWVIIFFAIFGKVLKKENTPRSTVNSAAKTAAKAAQSLDKFVQQAQQDKPVQAKPAARVSSSGKNPSVNKDLQSRAEHQKIKSERNINFRTLEDRSNDWLARQLREEDRIYRRGSELDLGASHQASCEADEIKRNHERVHGQY